MRTFTVVRLVDDSGVSGTGVVAEGVQFSDGTIAMRWKTKFRSTALYASLFELEQIHGHQGHTVVEFDEPGYGQGV